MCVLCRRHQQWKCVRPESISYLVCVCIFAWKFHLKCVSRCARAAAESKRYRTLVPRAVRNERQKQSVNFFEETFDSMASNHDTVAAVVHTDRHMTEIGIEQTYTSTACDAVSCDDFLLLAGKKKKSRKETFDFWLELRLKGMALSHDKETRHHTSRVAVRSPIRRVKRKYFFSVSLPLVRYLCFRRKLYYVMLSVVGCRSSITNRLVNSNE